MKTRKAVSILFFTFSLILFTSACMSAFNSNPVPPPDGTTDIPDVFVEEIYQEPETTDYEGEEIVSCGNGQVESGEECDDGNEVDGDGCDSDCRFSCHEDSECVDGDLCNGDEVCSTETHMCEAGASREDGFVCLADPRSICLGGSCEESTCGDGFVDTGAGESCEPPGEGACDSDCRLQCTSDADCPDDANICNGEEYCDMDAAECARRNPLEDGTECGTGPRMICISQTCQESTCGDRYVDTIVGEECDDGNDVEGDGCDNDCSYSCRDNDECDDGHDCTDDGCELSTHTCVSFTSSSDMRCRHSTGTCDVEEFCDGINPDCPPDTFLPLETVCRPSAGECDEAENCTGDAADCPPDGFAPSATLCRAAAGDCDAEEYCTGSTADCPGDAFLPDTTECRASTESCDPAENCTGTLPDCPADINNCTGYRRGILVDNTANPDTLAEYQVSVTLNTASLIFGGKMRSDCGDIRFRDSDETTPLNYWVESGCNSSSTLVWVKVPSIPASARKIIYVYYGDSGMTSQSSLPGTFLAGSDFEVDDGLTFVENSVSEPFGDSSGTLRSGGGFLSFVSLDRISDTYVYQALPGSMTDGYAARTLERITVEGPEGMFVQSMAISQTATDALSDTNQYALEIARDSVKGWNIVEDKSTSYDYAVEIAAPINTWYVIELQKLGSTAWMYVYDTSYGLVGSTSLSLTEPDQVRNYFHPYLKRRSSWTSVIFSGDQDWSLVRKYSSPEPTTSVGAEESV